MERSLKKIAPSLQKELVRKREQLADYDRKHFVRIHRGHTTLEPPRFLIWDRKNGVGYVSEHDRRHGFGYYRTEVELRGLHGRSHLLE